MKRIITTISILFIVFGTTLAQNNIYDPSLDGMKQIEEAVAQAKKEGKHVLCQVGGNWCSWCLLFADYAKKDSVVSQIIEKNYVYIHVNYSNANKNIEAMKYLGNPERYGFPVLVVIDESGKPLHIQETGSLEEGKWYKTNLVSEFLLKWTHEAVASGK